MSQVMIIGTTAMMIYHHRRELIKALINEGHQVSVIAPADDEAKNLISLGVSFYPAEIETRGTSVTADLSLLRNLIRIIRKAKPDVVLTFYTKTNIYGGIACRLTGVPYIENITGLGTALTGGGILSKIMHALYGFAVRKASAVFFQNSHNREYFRSHNLWTGKSTLLPGSGVSLERFNPIEYPAENVPVEFLFVGRVMKEKGIEEYLTAARLVKEKYPDTVFHVVGPCSPEYEEIITKAVKRGDIEFHGKVLDTTPYMKRSHAMVFPSYYPEGMANVLLESSASCRPVITTPLPGCKDAMDDGVTGLLTPPQNAEELARTLEKFILLPYQKRKEMGLAARRKMEKEFNREIIINAYIKEIAAATAAH